MRLFLAIELNDEARLHLYQITEKFNSEGSKIKWVAKRNMHLTVKFLGDVSDDKLIELKKRLGKIKFEKFQIELDKPGYFSEHKVRTIWVGLKNPDNVIKLQKLVDGELLDLFPGEQNFSTHVTLGRVKSSRDMQQLIWEIEKIKVKRITVNVDNFVLLESELTKDGPKYRLVERFTL